MTTYKAALFAPDGDWITDHRHSTVQDVWDAIDNQGSRWIFYPLPVVIVDHGGLTTGAQRIVAAPEFFENFRGKTLRTLKRFLVANPDVLTAILED